MTHLKAHLFGPLEVRMGEHAQPLHFPVQKTKSLLCYLLLNREAHHSRDRLASLWWGDHAEDKARHCLSTTLWRLRRTLGSHPQGGASFVTIENNEISFNTGSDYWLDVDEFQKLCALARQLELQDDEAAGRALQRAVALYREDLLPDCYEEWCLIERQRLQQLYLFSLSHLAAFHTRRHEFAESITCCQQILVCDPVREEVHRELIRLYLAIAHPQEALHQFQVCVSALKRDLGIEPMAETLALFHTLPAQDWGRTSSRTQQMAPQSPTDGAAANQELQDILTRFSRAAETITLANLQVQQALHRLEGFLARRDN